MSDAQKKRFLVLYLVPTAVIDAWSATDAAVRKDREDEMRAAWGRWMGAHASMMVSTDAGGKTKRVTSVGLADARNDIMLVSVVEADSHEEAAKPFENHPHLQIPQSSIEIMEMRAMGAP